MALALLRLIKPPGRIEAGSVWLDGRDLLTLSEEEMRRLRLARIALVPQGSMNSLNPVLRIRDQIADALRDHGVEVTERQLGDRLRDLLPRVGLDPEVAGMFPHQLSGGMKQRACIAIAVSLSPGVIVADEPTSALDVVVQRQVMDTLARAQTELGAAVILVGHDMGLMAQFVGPPGRHVRGPAGRDLAGPRRLHGAAPSVHADAHRQPAVARAEGRLPGDPRAPAAAPDLPAGLRVPSPLPARGGPLPERDARAPRGAARRLGRLSPRVGAP